MSVGLLAVIVFARVGREKRRKTNQRASRIDERVQANEGEHLRHRGHWPTTRIDILGFREAVQYSYGTVRNILWISHRSP